MKNEKKCTGSCSGACGGCEKPQNDKPGHIAHKAICEMAAAKAKAEAEAVEHEKCIDSQADEFLADCKAAGKNPMEVVAYIAKREQISISGDEPDDDSKKETYRLLRAVVSKIMVALIEDISAKIADGADFDMSSIGSIAARALSDDEDGDDDGCDYGKRQFHRSIPTGFRRYEFWV